MANKKNIEKAPYITKSDAKDPLLQLRKVDEGSFKIVVLSSFIIVTGSYAFGTCIGFTAPVQEAILRDLDLSIAQFSFFGSILSVGATIGAITSGHVSDYFGRKRAMRISCLITLIGWSAIYFSKGSTSLDVGRLLTGLGIGVFSYVVPVYISEIAPTSIRGGLIALNQLMIVLGISCTMLLGIVATWRQLALHGILPCVVMLFGLLIIPESPRWLAKVGKKDACEKSLRRLRGEDADISHEVAEVQESLEIVEHLPKVGILDLFQRRYIPSLTVTVGLMAFQQCGGVNGIGFYTSEIFLAAGNSSAKLGLALYAFIQIPINIMTSILIDKTGRKPLILFATLGTTLACLLIGICFLLKGYGLLLEWVPSLVVLGVVCFISSFSSGYGAIPWVMMSEVG
ncbi:sugar transporter ERD6-like 16 isoform X2 [Beta vulgaris subsp. vulgaris]|uniref:sugar transporter ERD6-like 16 isoform X2 n=1 Tax=Beta vulgaris subsp. vulgaris TaxID=3555 RepID=UPI00054016E8|nr:sugar transporter ERD6-like 16 isoform X2 [Beta vulgaris subsp. vulgaris]